MGVQTISADTAGWALTLAADLAGWVNFAKCGQNEWKVYTGGFPREER